MKPLHTPLTWPTRQGRARVLVEEPDGALLWAKARTLDRAGYDVAECEGPGATRSCPLLAGRGCGLVDGADVVVSSITLLHARHVHEAILASSSVPVVVEAADVDIERGSLAAGCRHLRIPVLADRLIAAVENALPDGSPCLR